MKLKFAKRTTNKKSDLKRIRREKDIVASIYIKGKDAEAILVKGNEFQSALRQIIPGRLSTSVFTLVDESGKERKAIIKDIQYHVTNYQVLHLDFEELLDDVKVKVNVPIEYVGAAESPGVKLGGAVRQVIRSMRVQCLPKDIPAFFQLDVKELGPRQAKRLGDIQLPQTIRALGNPKEVALVIVKR